MTTLLTIADVSEQLKISVSTLRRWREQGTGPRGVKVGSHLRYRQQDLDAWVEQQANES